MFAGNHIFHLKEEIESGNEALLKSTKVKQLTK